MAAATARSLRQTAHFPVSPGTICSGGDVGARFTPGTGVDAHVAVADVDSAPQHPPTPIRYRLMHLARYGHLGRQRNV